MTDMSFTVSYITKKTRHSANPIEHEQCFLTMQAALNFCVHITDLGDSVIDLVQYISGHPDGVLDGKELARAVARQRSRLVIP